MVQTLKTSKKGQRERYENTTNKIKINDESSKEISTQCRENERNEQDLFFCWEVGGVENESDGKVRPIQLT